MKDYSKLSKEQLIDELILLGDENLILTSLNEEQAKQLPIHGVSKCCDICSNDDVRTAVTMNETKVCHKCLNFIEKQSELNGTDKMEELNNQTKYVASNFC